MKQGKKSLNHDSPDLLDSIDLKNQAIKKIKHNQGLDEESAEILNSILELI